VVQVLAQRLGSLLCWVQPPSQGSYLGRTDWPAEMAVTGWRQHSTVAWRRPGQNQANPGGAAHPWRIRQTDSLVRTPDCAVRYWPWSSSCSTNWR